MKPFYKTYALVCLAVFIVIATGWYVFQATSDQPAGNSLVPKETISIADSRALSPCQALPETKVSEIYGTLGPKSYVDEKYYADSLSREEIGRQDGLYPNTVTCKYVLDDEKNSTVTVTVEQFLSKEDAQEDWRSAAAINKANATELLNQFRAEIPNAEIYNLDPEKLQEAADAFEIAIREIDEADESRSIGDAILYAPNRNGFMRVYGDKVVRVGYEFGSSNFFDENRRVGSGEVSQVSSKIKATFDVISANIRNTTLSQAPSPTLRGLMQNTKIGQTKILDACELFEKSIAEQGLGTNQISPVVERTSIRKDLSSSTTASNICLRRTLSNKGVHGYMSLEMNYAPSPEKAAEYFSQSLKKYQGTKNSSSVTTKAEQASYVTYRGGSVLVQFLRFQHGPYVGTMTISKLDDESMPLDVERALFQTTADSIIDKL